MQRGTPGAKQKQAQRKITNEMADFPDVVVHYRKAGQIHAHQVVKQRIQKSAGVLGGKHVRRLDRDKQHPQPRSDPGLDYFFPIRGQTKVSPTDLKQGVIIEEALLGGIVRGFPGNHHVVNVALT